MRITKTSPVTGKVNHMEIDITPEQHMAWMKGELIQDAMPNLTNDEREFIMTGYTKEDWEYLFGGHHNDED